LYSFYFFSQRKIAACNYTHFQSSAARSQPGDRKLCSRKSGFRAEPASGAALAQFVQNNQDWIASTDLFIACEYRANAAPSKASAQIEAKIPS